MIFSHLGAGQLCDREDVPEEDCRHCGPDLDAEPTRGQRPQRLTQGAAQHQVDLIRTLAPNINP